MVSAALTINWVNLTTYSPARKRQFMAFKSLLGVGGCCPDWLKVVVCTLPGDYIQDCPRDLVTKVTELTRMRDEEQCLPYVKDMLSLAMEQTEGDYDWIGIASSDIVYTPKFFDRLSEIARDFRAVIGRAVNVIPGQPMPTYREDHLDVLMIRRKTWERLEDGYPDMVFATWWDVTMMGWMNRYRIPFTEILEGELFHAHHAVAPRTSTLNQNLIEKFNRCEI